MPNTVGGPLTEVIITSDVGTRQFQVIPDNDPKVNMGGLKNSVKKPAQGNAMISVEAIPGSMKGVELVIDWDREDLEFLTATVKTAKLFDVQATNVSGVTYGGKLTITSDLEAGLKGSTISVDFEGNQLIRVA